MKRTTKAEKFFTEDERKRISETTRQVECCTIGEVAVMVVDGSDRYLEAEVTGGILLGSLLSLVITSVYLNSSLWFYVPLSLAFFLPARFIVGRVPQLKSAFIGAGRKEREVRERALRAFYEKGLYKTRANTGVLFFLSLFERKVWVLADRGILEKIGQETLNRFASEVSRGVREGRACDALCASIKEAGELLAGYFPVTKDDRNELTDEIITE